MYCNAAQNILKVIHALMLMLLNNFDKDLRTIFTMTHYKLTQIVNLYLYHPVDLHARWSTVFPILISSLAVPPHISAAI